MNWYEYARGSPIVLVDPNGNEPESFEETRRKVDEALHPGGKRSKLEALLFGGWSGTPEEQAAKSTAAKRTMTGAVEALEHLAELASNEPGSLTHDPSKPTLASTLTHSLARAWVSADNPASGVVNVLSALNPIQQGAKAASAAVAAREAGAHEQAGAHLVTAASSALGVAGLFGGLLGSAFVSGSGGATPALAVVGGRTATAAAAPTAAAAAGGPGGVLAGLGLSLMSGSGSGGGKPAADPTKARVRLRKSVREEIEAKQPRNAAGELIDPNTKQPLKPGEVDVGHVPGEEWRTRKEMHKERGSTREEVIETENDPSLYHLEDRHSNRSHRYEKK
ncbi:MAG: hypothetical protein JNL21_40595 [Myxococcales bacterium]|nr:hypothetical protein [Myxococcales bacterium]